MAQYTLGVAGTGDSENGINIIDERFQAEALRNIRTWDVGVIESSFLSSSSNDENIILDTESTYTWGYSNNTSTRKITIARGMASAYGYDLKSDNSYEFDTTTSTSQYIHIYLEWDFSSINLRKGSINSMLSSTQNFLPQTGNLIRQPNSIYQLPLYSMLISTNGTVSNVRNWTSYGIKTYKGVLWADICRLADTSKKSRIVEDSAGQQPGVATFRVGDRTVKITV